MTTTWNPNDPAFRALTDFHCEYPITVEGRSSIHDSLAHMSRLAVHALLVTRQEVESIDEQVIAWSRITTSSDGARSDPRKKPLPMSPRASCRTS